MSRDAVTTLLLRTEPERLLDDTSWNGVRVSCAQDLRRRRGSEMASWTPLVGMAMLDGHDLSIQVRDGGRVVIQAGE